MFSSSNILVQDIQGGLNLRQKRLPSLPMASVYQDPDSIYEPVWKFLFLEVELVHGGLLIRLAVQLHFSYKGCELPPSRSNMCYFYYSCAFGKVWNDCAVRYQREKCPYLKTGAGVLVTRMIRWQPVSAKWRSHKVISCKVKTQRQIEGENRAYCKAWVDLLVRNSER